MKQTYVIALTESLLATNEVDSVLKSTRELLVKKGHQRLWSAVLRGALGELQKRLKDNTPMVIVSNQNLEITESINKALEALGANSTTPIEISIDSTIIGGFIVRYKDRLLDASYKRALVDLYRQVTKS